MHETKSLIFEPFDAVQSIHLCDALLANRLFHAQQNRGLPWIQLCHSVKVDDGVGKCLDIACFDRVREGLWENRA